MMIINTAAPTSLVHAVRDVNRGGGRNESPAAFNDDYQHNSRANQPSAASDVNRGERNESPAAYNDDYQQNSRVNQPSLASAARDMNRVRGGAMIDDGAMNLRACCLLQRIGRCPITLI